MTGMPIPIWAAEQVQMPLGLFQTEAGHIAYPGLSL